ncbi:MAG: twin-arginine translocase subunit TatC [Limisphaerales bacterium]
MSEPLAPERLDLVPAPPPDNEEGGPIKPFLEHLEDLRWTLIKCVAALVISMVICLVASNRLVAILTWPLSHAQQLSVARNPTVNVWLGTNLLGRLPPGQLTNALGTSNAPVSVTLVPEFVGTNLVLALRPDSPTDPHVMQARNLVALKNYSPTGPFEVALNLMLFGGIGLASPFLLLFAGQFVLPAMKRTEKRFLYRAAAVGGLLFFLGVVFCYFIIMQVMLLMTVEFSRWMGFSADEWRAEDYIGFMLKFLLGAGLSFQLPVVLLTLVRLGLLSVSTLSRIRPYFIIGNLVFCAIVTPSGDPVTLLLLAVPLHVLYELSVLIAWFWARRERRQAAAAAP